ncbi:twin-arginine translocation signal domain-containing protein [Haloarchaeobius sp. TZWSO28]|uniref:twin-arginine translocation signal domain-containing protein n=1 Tax=Haloarchaeobius sp. TZWSO28 TaxID=3446119 RepID=UPI003EBF2F88
MVRFSRRRFLQTAATAGGATFAGCTSSIPGFGGNGSSAGEYVDWTPAAGGPANDVIETGFQSVAIDELRAHEAHLPDGVMRGIGYRYIPNHSALTTENTDAFHTAIHLGTSVYTGSFSASDVTGNDAFSEMQESRYEGYAIYRGNTAIAVTDGVYIHAQTADDVRATIDVHAGDGARAYDEDEDFATVADTLGSPTDARGYALSPVTDPDPAYGLFEGMVGIGSTVDIDGESYEATYVSVFDDPANVVTDPILEYLRNPQGVRNSYLSPDDATVEQSGRIVVVSSDGETSEL